MMFGGAALGLAGTAMETYGAFNRKPYDTKLYGKLISSYVTEMPTLLKYYQKQAPTAADVENILAQNRLQGSANAPGMLDQYGAVLDRVSAADPLGAQLRRMYMGDLQLGGRMSPSVRREIIQASLSNNALRGFGMGPRDAYLAYSGLGTAAENLRAQRMGRAQSLLGYYSSLAAPFMSESYGPSPYLQTYNPYPSGVPPIPDNRQAEGWMALGKGLSNAGGGMMLGGLMGGGGGGTDYGAGGGSWYGGGGDYMPYNKYGFSAYR